MKMNRRPETRNTLRERERERAAFQLKEKRKLNTVKKKNQKERIK